MNSELRGRARRLLIEAVYSYGGDCEDRLTEVLANVLEVRPDLCRLLTRRAGLRSDVERFDVETQVGAPGQRRLVDLVVRGSAPGGEVVSSLFVECKYNPQRNRDPYWFTQDQADRQVRALRAEPGERRLIGVCSKAGCGQRPRGGQIGVGLARSFRGSTALLTGRVRCHSRNVREIGVCVAIELGQ